MGFNIDNWVGSMRLELVMPWPLCEGSPGQGVIKFRGHPEWESTGVDIGFNGTKVLIIVVFNNRPVK